MTNGLLDAGATAQTALFGLAWFLVGLVLGRVLEKKKGAGANARISRRQPAGRNSGAGKVEIYVGNLPYDMNREAVEKRFKAFGKVASVRLISNRFNGKSKGYGFVEMPNRREAEAAIGALHGETIDGRKLVVNEAKSRARRKSAEAAGGC